MAGEGWGRDSWRERAKGGDMIVQSLWIQAQVSEVEHTHSPSHIQMQEEGVNMHLNIGVTNPVVRRAQLSQLIDEFLCPVVAAGQPFLLCGDTNACANKPEPEMAWCVLESDFRRPQALRQRYILSAFSFCGAG